MRRSATFAVSATALLLYSCGGGGGFGATGGATPGSSKPQAKKAEAKDDGTPIETEEDENVRAGTPTQVSGAFLTACGPADIPATSVAAGREALGCGVYKLPGFEKHTGKVAVGPVVFGDAGGRSETISRAEFTQSPAGSAYHVYSSLPAGMPAALTSVQGTVEIDDQVQGVKIVPQKSAGDWQVIQGIDGGGVLSTPGGVVDPASAVSEYIVAFESIVSKPNTGTAPGVGIDVGATPVEIPITSVAVDANPREKGRIIDGNTENWWSSKSDQDQAIRLTLDKKHYVSAVKIWPEYGYIPSGADDPVQPPPGTTVVSSDTSISTDTSITPAQDESPINEGTVHIKVEVGSGFDAAGDLQGKQAIFDDDVGVVAGERKTLKASKVLKASAVVVTISNCAPSHCAVREIKLEE